MNDFVRQFDGLKAIYRAKDDWECLPELVQGISALTGSSEWDENTFKNGILLYGAGWGGARAFEYFNQQGIKVLAFLDDTPQKKGTRYCGLDVMPFETARHGSCPIVLTLTAWPIPAAKLSGQNVQYEVFEHHVYRNNLKSLMTVAGELLSDDRSRSVYFRVLQARIFADYSFISSAYEGNQYWAIPEFSFLYPDCKGVMVDAGAYVGDTVEEFIWRVRDVFDRIHAFEPHPRLLSALKNRANRLQKEWGLRDGSICCNQAGLGDEESELPFFDIGIGNMAGSFAPPTGQRHEVDTIQTRKLDCYLAGAPVTFLKADVEGFEMPLLRGGSHSVRQHRPRIAMSLYHRMADMFELPLFLKSLVPEYKMAVRHHSTCYEETVLYCWV